MSKKKRPKKSTKMTSLMFTKRERENLDRLMEKKGMKMGEAIRDAIRRDLKREEERQ